MSTKFWERVREAELEVDSWPAWKRAAAERVYMESAENRCRWCHRNHDEDTCRLKPIPKTRYGQQRIRDRNDCPYCGGVGIACDTCFDFRGDPMG